MTGLDSKHIRDYYNKMSDEELILATTSNARGLTPEAYKVIDEILQSRNLSAQVSNAIEAQKKEYTIEEIDGYCQIIQHLNCPFCGSSASKLNGSLIAETASYLLVTTFRKKLVIGCPTCLDKIKKKTNNKTLLLGWWGFPWGPIRTIQALEINKESKKLHHVERPTNYLRKFTYLHIGQIEMHKNNRDALQDILKT